MTTGVLCPTPILSFTDNQGNPAVGGYVLTQIGGGNAATYQDIGLGTPLPNPIPLNSRGEVSTAFGASAQCFLTPDEVYTFTLFDAQGNQLWVATYVNGVTISAITVGEALYPYNVVLDGGIVPEDSNLHYPYGDVRRYGVIGDDVTDDTLALNTIGGAAWVQDQVITIPPGLACFTTDTVTLPGPYLSLMMDPSSFIDYAGTPDRACLVIGDDAQIISSRDFNLSVVFHGNTNTYADIDCVGVQIRGGFQGNKVRLNLASGFTINWQLYGTNSTGIAYNTFDLGVSHNAYSHMDIHGVASNGFINENLFLNGNFQTFSNYVPGTAGSVRGIIFQAESGGYASHNKNHFLKPCFQIGQSGVVGDRLPILFFNAGILNQFHNIRCEGYNGPLVTVTASTFGVRDNFVDIGYYSTVSGTLDGFMSETDGGFSYGNRISRYGFMLFDKVSYNDLILRAFTPSTGNVAVLGMFMQATGASATSPFGAGILGKDYILVTTDGLGVLVDTSYYKNFEVRTDTLPGKEGRFAIVAFDSSNGIISSTRAVMFGSVIENSNFGGHSYTQGADVSGFLSFRVDSNVDHIKLFWVPGTAGCSLRSFTITGFASDTESTGQNNGLAVYAGNGPYKQMVMPAIPTKLGPVYSNRGDTVANSVAASGVAQGWQCNLAGHNAADWILSTAYKLNQFVNNDTGKIYVCVGEGTSAGSGGPTGTGTGITDGTVTWNYVTSGVATWIVQQSNP